MSELDAGRWLDPRHDAVYHGQAKGPAGSAWVFVRHHTLAGPHVEVHRAGPDGELVRRVAVAHESEGRELVERLRVAVRDDGTEAVTGEVEQPIERGSIVVHASTGRGRLGAASLDDGEPTFLCAEIWMAPGAHRLAAGVVSMVDDVLLVGRLQQVATAHAALTIEAGQRVELHLRARFRLWRLGRPHPHWPCGLRA